MCWQNDVSVLDLSSRPKTATGFFDNWTVKQPWRFWKKSALLEGSGIQDDKLACQTDSGHFEGAGKARSAPDRSQRRIRSILSVGVLNHSKELTFKNSRGKDKKSQQTILKPWSNFIREFDPGSGWTLAACLTHASRTRVAGWSFRMETGNS